jgi:hypothetical protein
MRIRSGNTRHPKQPCTPTTFCLLCSEYARIRRSRVQRGYLSRPLAFDSNAPDACLPYVIEVVSLAPLVEAERAVRPAVDDSAVNAICVQYLISAQKGGPDEAANGGVG